MASAVPTPPSSPSPAAVGSAPSDADGFSPEPPEPWAPSAFLPESLPAPSSSRMPSGGTSSPTGCTAGAALKPQSSSLPASL